MLPTNQIQDAYSQALQTPTVYRYVLFSVATFSVSLVIMTFTYHTQKERLLGRKDLNESVKAVRRLKKATRHCWAR